MWCNTFSFKAYSTVFGVPKDTYIILWYFSCMCEAKPVKTEFCEKLSSTQSQFYEMKIYSRKMIKRPEYKLLGFCPCFRFLYIFGSNSCLLITMYTSFWPKNGIINILTSQQFSALCEQQRVFALGLLINRYS